MRIELTFRSDFISWKRMIPRLRMPYIRKYRRVCGDIYVETSAKTNHSDFLNSNFKKTVAVWRAGRPPYAYNRTVTFFYATGSAFAFLSVCQHFLTPTFVTCISALWVHTYHSSAAPVCWTRNVTECRTGRRRFFGDAVIFPCGRSLDTQTPRGGWNWDGKRAEVLEEETVDIIVIFSYFLLSSQLWTDLLFTDKEVPVPFLNYYLFIYFEMFHVLSCEFKPTKMWK